jgi:hypothetical protein
MKRKHRAPNFPGSVKLLNGAGPFGLEQPVEIRQKT